MSFKKGNIFGKKNKGLKRSEESKQKMSGEKHHAWKGNKVGYRSLHDWIQRKLGKATKCTKEMLHKSTRYHWANVSHEYKRDLDDWAQLCPSCNLKDRIGRRISP